MLSIACHSTFTPLDFAKSLELGGWRSKLNSLEYKSSLKGVLPAHLAVSIQTHGIDSVHATVEQQAFQVGAALRCERQQGSWGRSPTKQWRDLQRATRRQAEAAKDARAVDRPPATQGKILRKR